MGSPQDQHLDDRVVVGWRAAAQVARCSPTHLRRHAAQDLVPFTLDEGGRHVFKAADLLALRPGEDSAATHEEVDGETGEATTSADSGSVKPIDSDGQVASKVFELLNAREALTEVVVKLAVEPQRVAALHEEWLRMKERDVSGASVPRDIAELRSELEEIKKTLKGYVMPACDAVANLQRWVKFLRKRLDEDPLAGLRSKWECECGVRGAVAAKIECRSCGRESSLGWHAEEEEG